MPSTFVTVAMTATAPGKKLVMCAVSSHFEGIQYNHIMFIASTILRFSSYSSSNSFSIVLVFLG